MAMIVEKAVNEHQFQRKNNLNATINIILNYQIAEK